VQWGAGYQEKGGGFNEGGVNQLGWTIAGSADNMDFEAAISRQAVYASDSTAVFAGSTISILLEGDDSSYNNLEFAPPSGGIPYTFATQSSRPGPLFINITGNAAVVSWYGPGTLQSTVSLTNGGAWSDLPAASSPFTLSPSNVQQFFRLKE